MYKSLYPSIMLEFNVAPHTQYGRIMIPEKVYENENFYQIEEIKYSRGGEFLENMVTDNYVEFCHRWFGFPSFEEVIQDIDEYYMNVNSSLGRYEDLYYGHSPILPITSGNVDFETIGNSKVRSPIIFHDEPEFNFEQILKDQNKAVEI